MTESQGGGGVGGWGWGGAPGFAEPVISLLRKVKWGLRANQSISSQIWLSNVGTVDDYFLL